MGTSKGYIAPTTPHWSQAKRAVTSYINSGDGESSGFYKLWEHDGRLFVSRSH